MAQMEKTHRSETGQILPGINGSCTSLGCGACNREPRFLSKDKHHVFFLGTLQGTNISRLKVAGKDRFLLP